MLAWLYKGLGTAIGVVVLYLVLVFGASESGEVVQLVTGMPKAKRSPRDCGLRIPMATCGYVPAMALQGGISGLTAHSAHSPATLIRGEKAIS